MFFSPVLFRFYGVFLSKLFCCLFGHLGPFVVLTNVSRVFFCLLPFALQAACCLDSSSRWVRESKSPVKVLRI